MKLNGIIDSVKLCIDEAGASDYTNRYIDEVILNAIRPTLSWCARNAPIEMLTMSGSPFVEDYSGFEISGFEPWVIPLPADFVRLVRLYRAGWSKSISTLVEEDSDESLMQHDIMAFGVSDRPVAILRRTKTLKICGWDGSNEKPEADQIEITYIKTPSIDDVSSLSDFEIPSELEGAFVYHVAYLTLVAFGDERATSMYNVAVNFLK